MGRDETGANCIALTVPPPYTRAPPVSTLHTNHTNHCNTFITTVHPGPPKQFTLNPPPTLPCRYYRDALITMALAAAANSRDGHHQYVGVPLQVQVRVWRGGGRCRWR